jgi:predicted RecA/RadA family phage recombinase
MANNFVFKEAEYLSLPVPTGTRAGTAVRVGVLNAVTVTDEGSATQTIDVGYGVTQVQPSGGIGNKPGFASCALKGSAMLDVTGVTAYGTPVYIKTSDGSLQITAAAGTKLFGAALGAKGAAKGPVNVKILNGGIAADAA